MPSRNSSNLHISETTCIPASGPLAYAGAIQYLAVLAYPSRTEWPKRDKFVKAMKSRLLLGAVKSGYPKKQVKAEYRDEWRRKGGLRKFCAAANRAFDRIGTRRLPAVQMLRWILFHGFQIKLQFDSPEGMRLKNLILKIGYNGLPDMDGKRFSLNKAAEYYNCADGWLRSAENITNIKHRVWAESLPVLHLAAALEGEIKRIMENPPDLLHRPVLDYLILHPSWVPRVLEQAEMLRLFVTPLLAERGYQAIQLLPLS